MHKLQLVASPLATRGILGRSAFRGPVVNLSTLASIAADYGIPFTACVVLLYILVQGEFVFHYPGRQRRRVTGQRGVTKSGADTRAKP